VSLEINDKKISGCVAIIEFLEEANQGKPSILPLATVFQDF